MADHPERRRQHSSGISSDTEEEDEFLTRSLEAQWMIQSTSSELVLEPAPYSPDHEEESKEIDIEDLLNERWFMPDELAANIDNEPTTQAADINNNGLIVTVEEETEFHNIPIEHATMIVQHEGHQVAEMVANTSTAEPTNQQAAAATTDELVSGAPMVTSPTPVEETDFHNIPIQHATIVEEKEVGEEELAITTRTDETKETVTAEETKEHTETPLLESSTDTIAGGDDELDVEMIPPTSLVRHQSLQSPNITTAPRSSLLDRAVSMPVLGVTLREDEEEEHDFSNFAQELTIPEFHAAAENTTSSSSSPEKTVVAESSLSSPESHALFAASSSTPSPLTSSSSAALRAATSSSSSPSTAAALPAATSSSSSLPDETATSMSSPERTPISEYASPERTPLVANPSLGPADTTGAGIAAAGAPDDGDGSSSPKSSQLPPSSSPEPTPTAATATGSSLPERQNVGDTDSAPEESHDISIQEQPTTAAVAAALPQKRQQKQTKQPKLKRQGRSRRKIKQKESSFKGKLSQQELDSLIRTRFRETSAEPRNNEDDDSDVSSEEEESDHEDSSKDLKGFFMEMKQPSWKSVESRYSVPDASPPKGGLVLEKDREEEPSNGSSSSSSSSSHDDKATGGSGGALPLHSESTRVARGRRKLSKRTPSQKSRALRELEKNVHDSIRFLQRSEPRKGIKALVAMTPEDGGDPYPSPTSSSSTQSSSRLLHGFEALLGALLQLSDELELWSTFGRTPDTATAVVSADAIKSVLSHAPALNQIFSQFNPILEHFLEAGVEPDSEVESFMTRAHLLVQLLCEMTHKVCQRQEWDARAETAFVTLLELMDRTILEITCLYEGRPVPPFQMSSRHRRAWVATGHVQELKELFVPPEKDTLFFQHLCYDVLISTDHWCPNTQILGLVCNVGPGQKEASPPPEDARLAPIPLSALYVLDNIQGPPLPRTAAMTRILRRILPSYAILDPTIVRTAARPVSSTKSIVGVTSVPEIPNDLGSPGMAGIGKSTVAAMVASHEDVRRHFKDGVVWVHVGAQDMTYRRYTQCLRELCSQLVFYDGIPLFAELLHTPGETQAARTRREEGFMIYARDAVAELLRMRSVLIILDDVSFASDIEWFQFGPPSSARQSKSSSSSSSGDSSFCVLVTSRRRDLLPAADSVEIDLLDDRDAMQLFVTESGHPKDHELSESREARLVVMECANHPLAVKSVGRWLRLKEVTSGVIRSMEEINRDLALATDGPIEEMVKTGKLQEADMMYEVMDMSFTPYVNGEPTLVIKFCFAAFVTVFCDEEHHSNFLSTGNLIRPIIPMETADLLFQTLLSLEEGVLFQEGSPFFTKQREATLLIPEALSALGVLKVITSADDAISEQLSHSGSRNSPREQQYLQIIHSIQHEYGEHLSSEKDLQSLTNDGEKKWNREFAKSCLATSDSWDTHVAVASRDYAVEMLVSHMLRGELYEEAAAMLSDEQYVRGRLYSLGPENATRRQIADCEMLFQRLKEKQEEFSHSREPQVYMEWAYRQLSSVMSTEMSENELEEGRILKIEAGRANFEMGFSLAEKRCWKPAIFHWELSRKLLVASLGMTEFVAAILFNMGVALSQLNEYEQAMALLKQCLRIRGALHGEEHLLYAQTIQKIGDVFLQMSDFKEALESYSWAMEIVCIDSVRHRVDIGDILDSIGDLYYLQGEVSEALQYFEDALDSKMSGLGNEDPQLAITFQHIGNCLSDQGKIEEAVYNFEEAIRLMSLDSNGGEERDAHVLSMKGVLCNLNGNQDEGLKCYERALEILMRHAPHLKKKIADLLHLIGCVYLINGEHIKAMKLFEESLHTRRKMMGFVHLDVASTLFNMAFLHQTRNHPKKALKCLEEALKIRQLRLPDSEKVAVTHEKIGVLAKALGKRKKAEIAFEEALRIRISIYGKEHDSVASLLQELGDLMDDFGEFEEAMTYYAEALDVRRKRLGADHETVAAIMYSMGFAMYNSGRIESALHCFDEALIIWKSRIGTNSKEVGDTLNMMGFLQARRGNLDDALLLLLEALSIRKFQKDSVKVSETLMNMGNVHREKRQYELAVECYSDCLQIRRSELGDDHDKVADALIAVGNVCSDMERTDDALKAYEEALAIRSLVHGDNDEKVGKIYQHMGMIEFRYGDLHRARQLLEEFVRIRRKNETDNDGEFVNVLFVIGNIHKINGERYYARKNWTEAYNLAQDLGITQRNPQLEQAMNRLIEAGDIFTTPTTTDTKGGGGDSSNVLRRLTISQVKENLKDEKLPSRSSTRKRSEGREKTDLARKRKNL